MDRQTDRQREVERHLSVCLSASLPPCCLSVCLYVVKGTIMTGRAVHCLTDSNYCITVSILLLMMYIVCSSFVVGIFALESSCWQKVTDAPSELYKAMSTLVIQIQSWCNQPRFDMDTVFANDLIVIIRLSNLGSWPRGVVCNHKSIGGLGFDCARTYFHRQSDGWRPLWVFFGFVLYRVSAQKIMHTAAASADVWNFGADPNRFQSTSGSAWAESGLKADQTKPHHSGTRKSELLHIFS